MGKSQAYLQENYCPQNQLLILHLLEFSYCSAPFLADAEEHHYICLGTILPQYISIQINDDIYYYYYKLLFITFLKPRTYSLSCIAVYYERISLEL